MIASLNQLVDVVEESLTDDVDITGLASRLGTTEYHLRRMFSSLAGMPLSEYIRRRRMSVAAADVLGDDELLSIAVRYGYGSAEAFGRAFRAVHGASPGDVVPSWCEPGDDGFIVIGLRHRTDRSLLASLTYQIDDNLIVRFDSPSNSVHLRDVTVVPA